MTRSSCPLRPPCPPRELRPSRARALAASALPYAAFVTLVAYAAKERLDPGAAGDERLARRGPRELVQARNEPPRASDEPATGEDCGAPTAETGASER